MNANQILCAGVDMKVKYDLRRISRDELFGSYVDLLSIAQFRLEQSEFYRIAGRLESIMGFDV